MRTKHRNDKNHGKNGWVGGNPRMGKSRGNFKGQRAAMQGNVRRLLEAHQAERQIEQDLQAKRLQQTEDWASYQDWYDQWDDVGSWS